MYFPATFMEIAAHPETDTVDHFEFHNFDPSM